MRRRPHLHLSIYQPLLLLPIPDYRLRQRLGHALIALFGIPLDLRQRFLLLYLQSADLPLKRCSTHVSASVVSCANTGNQV